MPINPTLKLYYDFSITRGPEPMYGLGPTLTEVGSPTYDASGVSLDGSTQYLHSSDVTWFDGGEGVMYVAGSLDDVTVDANLNAFLVFSASNNRFVLLFGKTSNEGWSYIESPAGVQFNHAHDLGDWSNGELHRWGHFYETNNCKAAQDGTSGSQDTSFAALSSLSTLRIGADHNGTPGNLWNGYIKEVRYYDSVDGGTGSAGNFVRDLTNGLIREAVTGIMQTGVG